jgi:hypothetical protein
MYKVEEGLKRIDELRRSDKRNMMLVEEAEGLHRLQDSLRKACQQAELALEKQQCHFMELMLKFETALHCKLETQLSYAKVCFGQ